MNLFLLVIGVLLVIGWLQLMRLLWLNDKEYNEFLEKTKTHYCIPPKAWWDKNQ